MEAIFVTSTAILVRGVVYDELVGLVRLNRSLLQDAAVLAQDKSVLLSFIGGLANVNICRPCSHIWLLKAGLNSLTKLVAIVSTGLRIIL